MQASNCRPAKILALNVRSGGGTRANAICKYLDQSQAEIVVLTEWRDNASGHAFIEWSRSHGMSHAFLNDGGTKNGIFIASKHAFSWETRTPRGKTAGVLLLVRFANWTMLASYFPQSRAKADFFTVVMGIAAEFAGKPILIVGDLNTGNQMADRSPEGSRYDCAGQFDELSTNTGLTDLWRRTNGSEAEEWTWLSRSSNGFRIDHAFASHQFVEMTDPLCCYDHSPRTTSVSDHSALVVVSQSGF